MQTPQLAQGRESQAVPGRSRGIDRALLNSKTSQSLFGFSEKSTLSIYPEGVDGRMKVQSSMISFVRLGRDQANSEDAKCCLEWWCA